MAQPRKYLPLTAYLAALPPAQAGVTLRCAELEALVGPLSATARTSQTYWTAISAGLAWRALGFSARLHYVARSVTFTRRRPAPEAGRTG